MIRSQWFWNKMAKGYAKSPVADGAAYQHKLEITHGLLKPEMNLLEFGCGTGTTALTHAPHVSHIQAIDYSQSMIEIAKAKAWDASITNVSFDVSTIEDWSADPASYDMVQAHSILHLVLDLEIVLAKVRALIKPGGIFVSSTVCMREESIISRTLVPIASGLRILPFIGMFDGAGLIDAMKSAGFAVEYQWRPRKQGSIFIVARAI